MKKRFIMLFAVMAMLFCMPVIANAETGSKYGDYLYYEVNSDKTGITITDCDTAATEIIIPNVIDELPVTIIGYSAFKGCSSLTSITIPNSVTCIGEYAFEDCSSLENMTIPKSVTNIDHGAFSGCSGLTSMTIPDSVTSIGRFAFSGCSGLKTLTLGKGITSIGFEAFSGCSGLTTLNYNIVKCGITMTNSSGIDGYYPFADCPIEILNIGESVENIGKKTFWGCTTIKTINLNATSCSSMGGLILGMLGAESTFRDCTALTTVNIGENVTKIPDYAFIGCTGLTSITIPENVTSIGARAFYGCSGLTALDFNAIECSVSVEKIDDRTTFYPFDRCSLTTVNIGEKVTKIPNCMFSKCKDITNITIPDSVTIIGYSAFDGCSGLTSIVIPNNVTSIGYSAFSGCIGVTSIVIPDGITSIGRGTFSNCKNLINVTIPDTVNMIGAEAFANCKNLKHLTIPSGITKINDSTFYGCEGLNSLTIPDSVTIIDSDVFYHCYSLYDIYYAGNEQQWKRVYNYDTVPSIATMHYNSSYSPEPEPIPTPTPTPNPNVVETTVDTYEISDIQPTENGIKLTVKTNETVSGKQVVLVACYDENGAFVGLEWQEITASPTEQTVNVDVDKGSAASVKAFIWNALDYMMPASHPVDLKL